MIRPSLTPRRRSSRDRLARAVAQPQDAAAELVPRADVPVDVLVRDAERAVDVGERPRLRGAVALAPAPLELVRVAADVLGDTPLQHLALADRPLDERVPEVEDHRAHSRSTSQARRTSSSCVRALPIASRITLSPRSFVVATKTSPVAVARRASSSLSASSCRKHTVEKCRGADDLPAGLGAHPLLEQRREPDVLADQRLQAVAAVAAQHRPELERAEAASERRPVVAQVERVLRRGEVVGVRRERRAQRLGPARPERRAVDRREQPLVRVDDDRVGAVAAVEAPAQLRADRRRARVRRVDVQPDAGLLAAVGERRRPGSTEVDDVVPTVATTAVASSSGKSAASGTRRRPAPCGTRARGSAPPSRPRSSRARRRRRRRRAAARAPRRARRSSPSRPCPRCARAARAAGRAAARASRARPARARSRPARSTTPSRSR